MKITKQQLKQIIKEELGRALKDRRPALNEVSEAAEAAYADAVLKRKEKLLASSREPLSGNELANATKAGDDINAINRQRAQRTLGDIKLEGFNKLKIFITAAKDNDQQISSNDLIEFLGGLDAESIRSMRGADGSGFKNYAGDVLEEAGYLDNLITVASNLQSQGMDVNPESVRNVMNYTSFVQIQSVALGSRPNAELKKRGLPTVYEFIGMDSNQQQEALDAPRDALKGKSLRELTKVNDFGANYDIVTGKSIGDVAIDTADTGTMDTGTMDTGETGDTGAMDTGETGDTGTMDTGTMDTGETADTGTIDTGTMDTSAPVQPDPDAWQDELEYNIDDPDYDLSPSSNPDPFGDPNKPEEELEVEVPDINEIIRESFRRFL